jgi:sulfite reductase alpha subunit-like flavoprotein
MATLDTILPDGKERSALILYGSETGNAQDVAEELGRMCERLRFATIVCALDDIDLVRHHGARKFVYNHSTLYPKFYWLYLC